MLLLVDSIGLMTNYTYHHVVVGYKYSGISPLVSLRAPTSAIHATLSVGNKMHIILRIITVLVMEYEFILHVLLYIVHSLDNIVGYHYKISLPFLIVSKICEYNTY